MAATTITRSTWTNDTGTPASPVGDGTIINNARLQDIYANIDALIAATITFGGRVNAEGLGTHLFSAGGSGGNVVNVRNTSAGTSNYAGFLAGNDGATNAGGLLHLSSTYTTSGAYVADSFVLDGGRAGGLSLSASHASGVIRLYGGANLGGVLSANGRWSFGVGGAAVESYVARVNGTITPSSAATAVGLTIDPSITPQPNQIGVGLYVAPTLVEAASGTHAVMASAYFAAPALTTAGGATTSDAITVYINGAPTGATTNTALYVNGVSIFGSQIKAVDGSAGTPLYSWASDTDTGWYRTASGDVSYASDGTQLVRMAGATGAGFGFLGLLGGTWGTGNKQGSQISVGRNTSGSGAAGTILMTMRGGSARVLWVDNSGNLLIHTAAPTEDNTTVSDTAGAVVGMQTSTRASKRKIRRYLDLARALRVVLSTPLYGFNYRERDRETRFLGIMAEESPRFTMHGGRSFNPVNAFGYLMGAVQALAQKVERLEALAQ